ncbi:hypothetical protein QCN29_06215 [Streptomyces sp. HNM0663]|uniref:AAA family ATPase n=1 Tax=Streptomyces chengmaiensis TaxID=3040919 RepID=A0ABT6HIG5_9ACTN|nr:hypothetical protein [Streptomyces chengmaiensis]MDH2388385.1 hypothetical protein [Streptomyces chengmaiensis]
MNDDSARAESAENDDSEEFFGGGSGELLDFRDPDEYGNRDPDVNAAHDEALELEEWYRETLDDFRRDMALRREELRDDPRDEFDKEVTQGLMDGGFLEPPRFTKPDKLGTYETAEIGGGLTHSEVMAALDLYNERHNDQPREVEVPVCLDVGRFEESTRALFYRAQLNYLFGKGGAGKTNLLLKIAAEFVMNREYVVWFTFERMTGAEVRAQMIKQGVPEGLARTFLLTYHRRHQAPEVRGRVALVIIDAVNPCIGFMGGNAMTDPDGVDKMAETYFDPYAVNNPWVTGIAIDHVGHGNVDRPSGPHRKMDMFQGASYLLARVEKGVEGGWGYSELYQGKDNKGKTGLDDGDRVGYLVLDSTADPDRLEVRLVTDEPKGKTEAERKSSRESSGAKDIAERILRQQSPIPDADWRALIMEALTAANPKVEKATLSARMRMAISTLKKGVAGKNEAGEWVHIPSMGASD